jgi:hypothetical protein
LRKLWQLWHPWFPLNGSVQNCAIPEHTPFYGHEFIWTYYIHFQFIIFGYQSRVDESQDFGTLGTIDKSCEILLVYAKKSWIREVPQKVSSFASKMLQYPNDQQPRRFLNRGWHVPRNLGYIPILPGVILPFIGIYILIPLGNPH